MIASSCFCKAGQHRSYALLIAFLMWAGNVHDYSVWSDLIATLRNEALTRLGRHLGTVQLGMEDPQERKGDRVPCMEVLLKFTNYLNSTKAVRRWPMQAT